MKQTALVLLTCLAAATAPAIPTSPGSALQFNGVNSYVSIATAGSLTGTFTVELWANPNHPTNALSLVGSRSVGEYSFDMKFWKGTQIHGDIGNGSSWSSTAADGAYSYATGTWSHIAYVVTPTTYTVYANGFQIGSGTYGATTPILFDANHQLVIGNFRAAGTESMNGQIDEVRIWNTARTASQLSANAHTLLTGTEAGLIGYWRFDEGSGTTSTDSSGHGFTATLVNVTWVNSAIPVGTPNAPWIHFDDVTDGTIIDTHYIPAFGVTLTNPIGGHIYARSGLGKAMSQPNVVSIITGDTNSANYSIFPFFDAQLGAVDAYFSSPVHSVSIDVMPVSPLEFLGTLQNRPFLQWFDVNGNYMGTVYYSGPLPTAAGFATGPMQTLTLTSPNNGNSIGRARFSSQQNAGGARVYGFFDNLRFDRVTPPPMLTGTKRLSNGAIQFLFSGTPGMAFLVLASSDLSQPMSAWSALGSPTEISAGQYQFTDSQAPANSRRFYRVRGQ